MPLPETSTGADRATERTTSGERTPVLPVGQVSCPPE